MLPTTAAGVRTFAPMPLAPGPMGRLRRVEAEFSRDCRTLAAMSSTDGIELVDGVGRDATAAVTEDVVAVGDVDELFDVAYSNFHASSSSKLSYNNHSDLPHPSWI